MSTLQRMKVLTTIALWVIAALVVIRAMEPEVMSQLSSGDSVIGFVAMALVLAIGGTFLFWVLPEMRRMEHADKLAKLDPETESEKTKRRGGARSDEQLALLFELLDEAERETFKERLQQRVLDNLRYSEGELPYTGATLAALLDEEKPQRRRD